MIYWVSETRQIQQQVGPLKVICFAYLFPESLVIEVWKNLKPRSAL